MKIWALRVLLDFIKQRACSSFDAIIGSRFDLSLGVLLGGDVLVELALIHILRLALDLVAVRLWAGSSGFSGGACCPVGPFVSWRGRSSTSCSRHDGGAIALMLNRGYRGAAREVR